MAFHFKQYLVTGVLLCGNLVHRTISSGAVSACCGRDHSPPGPELQEQRPTFRTNMRPNAIVLRKHVLSTKCVTHPEPQTGTEAGIRKKDKQRMEAPCFTLLVVQVLKGMGTNSSLTLLGSPDPPTIRCDTCFQLTGSTGTYFRKHLNSQQLLKNQITAQDETNS